MLIKKEKVREMLDNNIQNEKAVQNGIQNVHQKFTARQNELRYISLILPLIINVHTIWRAIENLHFRCFRWTSRNMKRLSSV